jgi:predicted amidohydrolase YtcJ
MDDPEGGTIVRDEDGRPTGVFVDAAMGIVGQEVPDPSDAELDRVLDLALQETAKYGLTGVHDAGANRSTIQRYQRFIDEGRFNLRVYAMIGGRGATFDHYCDAGPLHNYDDRLAVRSVKFYIDGALGSRGAALLEDYSDDPGNRGLLQQQPDRFRESVRAAMACGFQVNTHAIGDRGNRIVLDTYEAAMDRLGTTLGRHRVEHAQIVAPRDLDRFAELDVIASMQPTHATSDMYWAEDRLGAERIEGAYAWRSLLDSGARVAFGSDFPVEQVNPVLGFYAAVTRQDAEQYPEGGWHPEERVTRREALRGFTLDAAYSAFQEDELGSLEPGKLADFVILSRDIMEVRPEAILDTEVVATYLGGAQIYARDGEMPSSGQ